MPRSTTPAGRERLAFWRPDVAFRHHNGVGSHDYHLISELDNAAYTLAVYASRFRVTPLPARLASGWLPALARRD